MQPEACLAGGRRGSRPAVLMFGALGFAALVAAAVVPIPFAPGAMQPGVRAIMAALTCLPIVLGCLSYRLVAPRYLAAASLLSVLLGLSALIWGAGWMIAGAIWVVCATLLVAMLNGSSAVPGAGLASLLVTIGFAAAFEAALRALPHGFLAPDVEKTPPLIDYDDRGNLVFRKNGFRGKLPCRKCPENTIKIFSMGGSSTYGIPMYHTTTAYPAVLQSLLERNRPAESYEVFNAGIPGYGIVQILESLREEILKHSPDIVTVCAWFNDTAPAPGWYRIPGKSDMEAYQMVRALSWLQNLPIYRDLHATRTFGLFRHLLLQGRDSLLGRSQPFANEKRPRMSADEFGAALRELSALGKEKGFLPVLVPEPINRVRDLETSAKDNPYYRVTREVAAELDLPLVDVVSEIAERHDEWFFYDIVHTNEAGHRLVAETIYDTLFDRGKLTNRAREFLAAKGVDLDRPGLRASHEFQIPGGNAGADGAIEITASAPNSDGRPISLEISRGSESVAILAGLGREPRVFELRLPERLRELPIVDLVIRGRADLSGREALYGVGATGARMRAHLIAESGGVESGRRSTVRLSNQLFDPRSPGLNVFAIDPAGRLVSTASFSPARSEGERLIAHLRGLAAVVPLPVVVVSANTDGAFPGLAGLGEALAGLGGSGAVPEASQPFLLVGTPGAPAGSAIERNGSGIQRVEIGEPELPGLELSEVAIPR